MSNRWFDFPTSLSRFVRNTLARAVDINARFDEVSAGLDVVQTEMDLKSPSLSPTFTGTPLAPNPATVAVDTTQIATTAWVQDVIGATTVGLPPQLTHAGKALFTDGTSAAWMPALTIDEFAISGSWTKPAGAQVVMVMAWGGGGGGGSGRRGAAGSWRYGGGGGGGGGRIVRWFQADDLTSPVAVDLGDGGTGGAAVAVDDTDGNPGIVGGNTTFGSYCTAYGGGAGVAGTASGSSGAYGGGVGRISPAVGTATGQSASGEVSFTASSATVTQNTYSGESGGGCGGASGNVAPAGVAGLQGASSVHGGCGGGSGSGIATSNARYPSASGGTPSHFASSGGGGAATSSIGGAGGAGAERQGGGGGGAGSTTAGTAGGTGGAGGPVGGGGGGGGASVNTDNSGAGGAGGRGHCIVYTW